MLQPLCFVATRFIFIEIFKANARNRLEIVESWHKFKVQFGGFEQGLSRSVHRNDGFADRDRKS